MKVLVLGGTWFVGRHIVDALCRAGHAVTVFNRGRSPLALPAQVERLRGDRDLGAAGLDALRGRAWDACVDCSGYTATHVRPSAELLRDAVSHYVYLSAVSVYGDPPHGPVTEAQPCVTPAGEDVVDVDRVTYGPLKVTCERIVEQVFGPRCALLRPQIVAGPFDPVDRLSYWVRRAGEAGPMLAPGDGSDHVQFVDALDCARFVRLVCEHELAGAFNVAGPRIAWREFIGLLGARSVAWVPATAIAAAGLTEFELPLYRPEGGRRAGLMHVASDRARHAGLTASDLRDTIERVRRWLPQCTLPPALSREREAALIAAAG